MGQKEETKTVLRTLKLPTFGEFLNANKQVFAEEVPWMAFVVALTFLLWLQDLLNPGWSLFLFPRHFFGEWMFFAQLGSFLAEVRKTIIPPWIMLALSIILGILVVGNILGFTVTSVVFGALFISPMPFGFGLQKASAWKKARVLSAGK